MEINRDYDEYNVSNKLVAMADLVIVKHHTSIGDEALAAGIPVFFCDFMPNLKKVVGTFFDYEKYPVFVHSYEELQHRVDKIVNHGFFMDEEQFAQMRKRFLGDFFDGKIKERLHRHLMQIYNDLTDKPHQDIS